MIQFAAGILSLLFIISIFPFRTKRVRRVKDVHVRTLGMNYGTASTCILKDDEFLKKEDGFWHVYKKVFYYERKRKRS